MGMMSFIVFMSESELIEGVPPYVLGVAGAMSGFVLAAVAYRFFNRRSSPSWFPSTEEPTHEADAAWHFTFTNTVEELLTAERAERQESSGMNVFFRGVTILLGMVWIVVPFLTIGHATHVWQPVISVLLGLFVLRSLVLKPFLARYRIRRDYAAPEEIDIEIGEAGIHMSANGMKIEKRWDQLLGVLQTPEGIVFYWQDETKSWLPATTVGSKDTIHRVTQFIQRKVETCRAP